MNINDFDSVKNLWVWLENDIIHRFNFLIFENAFKLEKSESSSLQLTIEYMKNNEIIGFWCEYGSRPELFIKVGRQRLFTDAIRKKTLVSEHPPVSGDVFGRRVEKKDYEAIMEYYAKIVRIYLNLQ